MTPATPFATPFATRSAPAPTATPAYLRPATVGETVGLLTRHPGAHLLAGGSDLMNELRLGLLPPATVIDTADLPELHVLSADGDIVLGAGITMRHLLTAFPPADGRLRALRQAADLLGGRQIQAVATLGGNICHASPAAETAPPLLVHDTLARIAGPHGERTIPVADLWTAPRRTSLTSGEILLDLRIPAACATRPSAYRRIELRRSVDIAVVSAAAALETHDGTIHAARLALGAAGPVPFRVPEAERLLTGVELTLDADGAPTGPLATALAQAAQACTAAARPISDVRSGAEYRRQMTAVVARRALEAAARKVSP
ncbi:FAD binding domain-containing protein [Streptosporangium sp. NPDC051022]|uniref:FAD binding domain-containing protein n=1 Tax=Streptosporangium sp. NPDC051022 TaxID=3155752 RepID=UPI00341B5AD4